IRAPMLAGPLRVAARPSRRSIVDDAHQAQPLGRRRGPRAPPVARRENLLDALRLHARTADLEKRPDEVAHHVREESVGGEDEPLEIRAQLDATSLEDRSNPFFAPPAAAREPRPVPPTRDERERGIDGGFVEETRARQRVAP